jgi:hypothetical protein
MELHMLKIANQVIDVYDDVFAEGIKKVASINENINVMSSTKRQELDDTDFALSIITKEAGVLNKFPCSDHDSTWLSNQYFDMNHKKLPLEAQEVAAYHIKKACMQYNIDPTPAVEGRAKTASSNVYVEKEATFVKSASVNKVDLGIFAEVEKIASNYTAAQYAMPNQAGVKLAQKYFEEFNAKMPLDVRVKYAGAIQRRAHELGMQKIAGAVGKYVGDSYSAQLDAHLISRKSLLDHQPVMKIMLDKLASVKESMPAQEFAGHLHSFDKRAGLTKYYDAGIKNPYEAVIGMENPSPKMLYKTASKSLTEDELAIVINAKYPKIQEYFGETLAKELKSNPQAIFDSLPRDYKEIIVNIANGNA